MINYSRRSVGLEGLVAAALGVEVSRSRKKDKQRCPFLRQRDPIVWVVWLASRDVSSQVVRSLLLCQHSKIR